MTAPRPPARDRLLASLGVDLVRGRAKRVDVDGARVAVTVDGRADLVMADTCVLACGGVLGGGVLYTPPEHDADADLPPPARAAFALSLDAPVALAIGGAPVGVVSSTSGPDLDETAWPSGDRPGVLEAVGVRCRGVRAAEGIAAAGDAIADRPRTVLEAVAFGLRAGREAGSLASS